MCHLNNALVCNKYLELSYILEPTYFVLFVNKPEMCLA